MQGYYQAALRYLTPGFVPTISDTVYPPGAGYFFGFLHKLDPSWALTQWTLLVLSSVVPLVIGWIAWTLFGASVASLSTIFASIYFPWVDYYAFFLSEAAFIPASVAAVALLLVALRARTRWTGVVAAVGSGLMFGLASSVKTVALASLVLLAVVLVWWRLRSGLRGLYRVVFGMIIGVTPVMILLGHRCTNANEGRFCLVSNNGPVTTIFGHTAWVRSITWVDSARGMTYGWGCPVSAQRSMFNRDLTFNFGPYDNKENSRKIVEIVRENPLEALALSYDQICNLFYGTIPWPSSHSDWTRLSLETEQLFLLVCMVPALLHLRRRARPFLRLSPLAAPEILLATPIVALVVTCFLTQGDPRYRIPLDGFIMILASAEILGWFGVREEIMPLPGFAKS
jgi:hypothetical protein